jgi:hypothetical protein
MTRPSFHQGPWQYTLTITNLPNVTLEIGKKLDVVVEDFIVLDVSEAKKVLKKFMLKGNSNEQSE